MRRLPYLIFAVPLLFLLSHCEENPVNLAGDGNPTVTDTLYAVSNSTFRRDSVVVNTSLSSRLLIGGRKSFECRPAVRFISLPDTSTVISAFLRFTTVRTSAEGGGIDLPVTVHPIDSLWATDIDSIWGEGDEYRNNVDFSRTFAQGTVPFVFDSSTADVLLELNQDAVDLINDWIRFLEADTLGRPNAGFFIDYDESGFGPGNTTLVEFEARQSGNNLGPSLLLQYVNTDDSTVVDTFLAASDVFFIEGEFEPVPDRLHTTTLRPWAFTLDFDYGDLSDKYNDRFAVSSASLELTVDWDNSYITPGFAPGLQLLPYSDSTGTIELNPAYLLSISAPVNLTSFAKDSLIVQTSSGGERQDLARIYIQAAINDSTLMDGFHIDAIQKNSNISYFSFFPIDAADPAKRPRLIVKSIILPEDLL